MNSSIENILREFFQTYGLLCREFGMPMVHNVSHDPCYNEVASHTVQKIQQAIPNHVVLAICLNTNEYFLGHKNEFNIEELIIWKGNASIITGHGFYNVESDGNKVNLLPDSSLSPWSKLFNQKQVELQSHSVSADKGLVFWIGDSSNVLIPGTYMSNRPSLDDWNAMLLDWYELNAQFNALKQMLLWRIYSD